MNAAVCIKQVPSGSVPTDAEGNLQRDRGGTRLNPRDEYALEAALTLARETGGSVTAITMGPPSAEAVLKTAFALGADRGILLTDRAFAGADVYATAYTLSQGIRALGGFDVIVCGQQSTDGDTAQLPFSLGIQLGIPVLGWVKHYELTEGRILVHQELSQGTQQVIAPPPCVLAVGTGCRQLRIPSLGDQLRARSRKIQVLALPDLLDSNAAHYGRAASPTRVVGTERIEHPAKNLPAVLSGEATARRIFRAVQEAGHE